MLLIPPHSSPISAPLLAPNHFLSILLSPQVSLFLHTSCPFTLGSPIVTPGTKAGSEESADLTPGPWPPPCSALGPGTQAAVSSKTSWVSKLCLWKIGKKEVKESFWPDRPFIVSPPALSPHLTPKLLPPHPRSLEHRWAWETVTWAPGTVSARVAASAGDRLRSPACSLHRGHWG